MLKTLVRSVTPPVLWQALHHAKQVPPRYGHFGDYATWDDAIRECGDAYETRAVLELTLANTKITEQNSHLTQLDARLLCAIQYALLRLAEPVRILDFGGAMGTHYFRHRRFLQAIKSWTVVELPATVRAAKHLEDGVLRFSTEIETADLVIASGSLQCVPNPRDVIRQLRIAGSIVILDKVPIFDRDRLTVNHVDPSLFGVPVKMPAWFFRNDFPSVLSWDVPEYHSTLDGEKVGYHGFMLA